MKKGTCKLCLEEKELCKESHIIPRFLYKFLHGKNNSLVYLDSSGPQHRYNSEYESHILCKECDNGILGKLDDYAAKFIYKEFATGLNKIQQIDGRDCLIIEDDLDYNYTRFKLFLLSLLWRGSISSRPFFKNMKLDSEIEENLRFMIKNGQPGKPEEYACFIYMPPLMPIPGGGRGFHTFYMPTISPQQARSGNLEICEFTIIGTKYYFVISKSVNSKVLPGVDENKLTIGFSSVEEQRKLMQFIIQTIQGHQRK